MRLIETLSFQADELGYMSFLQSCSGESKVLPPGSKPLIMSLPGIFANLLLIKPYKTHQIISLSTSPLALPASLQVLQPRASDSLDWRMYGSLAALPVRGPSQKRFGGNL